jgi:hypothetical protein
MSTAAMRSAARMEAVAAATAVHSLGMGVGMSVSEAFFPAATSTAAVVAVAVYGESRRALAWNLTVASMLFVLVLGLAVGPREYLYESLGAYYLFLVTVATFSGFHNAGEATSGCMLGALLAAVASVDSTLGSWFRWLAAAAAVLASVSCLVRLATGRASPTLKFVPTGGPFDVELAVARVLGMPLLLAVVYSQSTEKHALNAGEALAALLVAIATTTPSWTGPMRS